MGVSYLPERRKENCALNRSGLIAVNSQEQTGVSGHCVRGAVASLFLISLPACSTVIRTADAVDETAVTEERAALKEAAAELAWSPWPKPEGASFAVRFAGGEEDGRMTRDRAVDIYIGSLGGEAPAERIAADVRRHLVAADQLADIAARASDSANPRLSDVAVLEASIADLRETRAVYIAALKKLDAGGDALDAVREPLDSAVKKLGRVADDLAESAMKRRSSNFAGPDALPASTGAL